MRPCRGRSAGARCGERCALLVAPLRRVHVFKFERLLVELRRRFPRREIPRPRRTNKRVVARRLAIRRLILLPEVNRRRIRCAPAHRDTSVPPVRRNRRRAPPFRATGSAPRPMPVTLTSRQNCSRSAGISPSAVFRPSACATCRSSPTSAFPIRDDESTERVPLNPQQLLFVLRDSRSRRAPRGATCRPFPAS